MFVKPSMVQAWVAANAAGSLKATPKESWRAYLLANGGYGSTERDLERGFLETAGYTSGTQFDRWQAYLAANGGGTGNARTKFQAKFK